MSLTDAHALTLGTVTTTGDLTVNSTGALNLGTSAVGGNLIANSGNGQITQGGPLTVAGTSSLSAGTGDVTLTNGANDFTGAVTLTGAATQIRDMNALTALLNTTGDTLITAGGNLTVSGTVGGAGSDLKITVTGISTTSFGATTVAGDLLANSASAVNQTGPLTVKGASQISAPGQSITLDNLNNDFTGAIALTAAATQIRDKNALTAVLNTTGDTLITASGNLTVSGTVSGAGSDLTTSTSNGGVTIFGPGSTSVDGNLSVIGGGGDVIQTGRLNVLDLASFDAGSAAVTLAHPDNRFNKGIEITASSYTIVGDSRRDALRALEAALSIRAGAPISGAGGLTATAPQPLVIAAAPAGARASSGSSSSASGNAAAGASSSSGITIDLNRGEAASAVTIAAVSLPKGTSTAGSGFSFVLPDSVTQLAVGEGAGVRATTVEGTALPGWLKFDPKAMKFEATAVPDGAFPVQVAVLIGTQRIVVVISERTSD